MKRRVLYVSGTRADFGLMRSTLLRLSACERFDVSVVATGPHLMAAYGMTVEEIRESGLRVAACVDAPVAASSGSAMANAIAASLAGIVDVIERERPDVVMLLGDRGEMLAAAIAAVHVGVPVVHLHGGERSGTIDEPVRHAISKLAHYHFVATPGSRERLLRMGESADRVFVTGAPGLDGLAESVLWSREQLAADEGFDPAQRIALMVFHPVVQDAAEAGSHAAAILQVMRDLQLQVVCVRPNSDAGSAAILAQLEQERLHRFRLHTHLPRDRFVSWMNAVDVMIGNSSSGIIEAPTFGIPVVNVGDRQAMRERCANIIDTDYAPASIRAAVGRALKRGRRATDNVYGDGRAGERIVGLLSTIALDATLLKKTNAY